MHGILELQNSIWKLDPGQLFPFWHVLRRNRAPPWHVALHAPQVPHEAHEAVAGESGWRGEEWKRREKWEKKEEVEKGSGWKKESRKYSI